jgi:type IX secretion system PorP/SprF family membrane protein
MRSVKKIFLLFMISLLAKFASAQDINFSQFYDLPLLRNPSLAGLFSGDIRITSAYRNQWQSVTVPYRTFGLGFEYKKPIGENSDDFFTYGLQLSSDVAGDSKLSRTQVFPVFNYHKSLGNKNTSLSAGIMGGPVMQRFDPSKLRFDDQFVNGSYSPANPTKQTFSSTKLTYWDAAAGLCFSGVAGTDTRYYIGVGMFHFTQPKVAFQQQNDIVLNHKWVVNAGFSAPVADADRIIFYADYFMQGGARQAQGGLLWNHDLVQYDEEQKISISGGAFYRGGNDAFMPVVKLDYYQYSVGVSYDVNSSKLKSASQYRGAYEVTLSYKAFNSRYNTSASKVKCPVFY